MFAVLNLEEVFEFGESEKWLEAKTQTPRRTVTI